MQRIWRENSLSIVLFGLFALFWVGQLVTGYNDHNEQQRDHNRPEIGFLEYLGSGAQFEATFENWESEFLQMGAFVVLTAVPRQKGSPESKKLPDETQEGEGSKPKGGRSQEAVDADPRDPKERKRKDAPLPVQIGGPLLTFYENSLSVVLFILFFAAMALHVVGGAADYSQEQLQHGGEAVGPLQYLFTWRMWFESFQNWQSEFMSVGVLVVLTIFLRQRGSHESKPVAAPHSQTGAS